MFQALDPLPATWQTEQFSQEVDGHEIPRGGDTTESWDQESWVA